MEVRGRPRGFQISSNEEQVAAGAEEESVLGAENADDGGGDEGEESEGEVEDAEGYGADVPVLKWKWQWQWQFQTHARANIYMPITNYSFREREEKKGDIIERALEILSSAVSREDEQEGEAEDMEVPGVMASGGGGGGDERRGLVGEMGIKGVVGSHGDCRREGGRLD